MLNNNIIHKRIWDSDKSTKNKQKSVNFVIIYIYINIKCLHLQWEFNEFFFSIVL